jgi:hypothetical protein
MSFNAAQYLSRATGRAKSDVANKMISMFLHRVSREVVSKAGLRVTDQKYVGDVIETFGEKCTYCRRPLQTNGAAVEHLDGVNRFRAGLHIPGNVTLACVQCNREKRRDDQLKTLILSDSGWGSFLSHNSQDCPSGCKSCSYWASIWPDPNHRQMMLKTSHDRILRFRKKYASTLQWGLKDNVHLLENLECLYRESQEFASTRIDNLVEISIKEMELNSDT